MLQRLAGIDEGMNNFCKQQAESFHGFIVVIHIKRSQWHLLSKRSQSACLAKVSVTKQLLRKFPNSQKSWGNWACVNSVYQTLFSPPTHKSLVTRLESSQTTLATKQFGVPLEVWVQLGVCLYWACASICNLAHLFQKWSCTVATYIVAVSDENGMLFHSIIISVSSSCSKHCIAKLFCVELSLYNCITARISWLFSPQSGPPSCRQA